MKARRAQFVDRRQRSEGFDVQEWRLRGAAALPHPDHLAVLDDRRPEHAVVAGHQPVGVAGGHRKGAIDVAEDELVETGEQQDTPGGAAVLGEKVGQSRVEQVLHRVGGDAGEPIADGGEPGARFGEAER